MTVSVELGHHTSNTDIGRGDRASPTSVSERGFTAVVMLFRAAELTNCAG
jgi:hypothetical protein